MFPSSVIIPLPHTHTQPRFRPHPIVYDQGTVEHIGAILAKAFMDFSLSTKKTSAWMSSDMALPSLVKETTVTSVNHA